MRRQVKQAQEQQKAAIGDAYTDYDLVIAHEDGRPYEERQIAHLLEQLVRDTGLPVVVFHSLRHCSASLKLRIGGGNIKAVQGDTGHAQARMVTDLYAHTNNEDRRLLAQKVEADFFQKGKGNKNETAEGDIDDALRLLKENPALAKLLVAALQK